MFSIRISTTQHPPQVCSVATNYPYSTPWDRGAGALYSLSRHVPCLKKRSCVVDGPSKASAGAGAGAHCAALAAEGDAGVLGRSELLHNDTHLTEVRGICVCSHMT